MTKEIRHYMDEADIGSGEKNAGELETELEIGKINPGRKLDQQAIKDAEKREGLVDEEHPFPPKGN
ncbi:hypothetical protein ACIQW9_04905 [Herminiimonas sp. NPDC097707]|uniref:hypothetical protein n=1 Tax=Herminiimonas sp. NPDC097707 TaxID=3364007 RepID=UPI00383A1875